MADARTAPSAANIIIDRRSGIDEERRAVVRASAIAAMQSRQAGSPGGK